MKNKIWLNLVLLLQKLNVYSQTFDELMTIGDEKYGKKDYKGAIISISKAIELNPKNSVSYMNRGVCKSDLGDKKGACIDLNKALDLGFYQAESLIKELCK